MSAKSKRPKACLLALGDELLNGQQLDTNSSWLSEKLWALGWEVKTISIVGDDEQAIVDELAAHGGQVDLILTTGGLGPTLDDLTRHAVARAAGCEIVLDDSVCKWLEHLFAELGRKMSPANERQALFPEGAQVLANSNGTAPGFRIQLAAGAWVVSMPGPPREVQSMFEEQVLPFLVESFGEVPEPRVAKFFLYGLPESVFAKEVGEWMSREAEPRMGVCASGRVLKVRIESTQPAVPREEFDTRVNRFAQRFDSHIFSRTDPSTARALGSLLMKSGVTFACAESCTGGEVASRLVAQEGISQVFLEGFVTYSNRAKMDRLGIPQALLKAHGAVSPQVAGAMAAGAARATGARLTLSTTGVAGPGGGSDDKPVGLVQVGICCDGEVSTHELRFPQRGRDLIRDWSVTSACELARRALLRICD
ncbi:MAG: nicotinamide-nucleotide amidase [Candidatus Paceibacteria bacterium]|jgi:nicotinamide-nucleotide amidase